MGIGQSLEINTNKKEHFTTFTVLLPGGDVAKRELFGFLDLVDAKEVC